jgi:ubiquinone/menaquinone biosynthesis C-methylase UbiE
VYNRALYAQLAKYYDRIYWSKDYGREARFLVELFRRNGVTGKRLLEVGCGTGNHTKVFAGKGYRVTALDISGDVLDIARRKVRKGARFVQGDMRRLDASIEGGYDAAVCLFSTISYNTTNLDLRRTLGGIFRHLNEGGILAFDTHFTKEAFLDGYRGEDIFDDGRVIGARLSVSKRRASVGEISFTYLIKDGPRVITLRNDIHRLGLFSPNELLESMKEAGFTETRAYSDWTFRKAGNSTAFKDIIFVGRKRAA